MDVERPCRGSVAEASERFDVLVGHWLCPVDPAEVKVQSLACTTV